MPQGDKRSYTSKQKRQAEHIAESYQRRGKSVAEAKRRAWATVNDQDGGGKKSGSGRGKPRKTSVKDPGRGPDERESTSNGTRSAARKKSAAKKKSPTKTSASKKASTRKASTTKAPARKKSSTRKSPARKSSSSKTSGKTKKSAAR